VKLFPEGITSRAMSFLTTYHRDCPPEVLGTVSIKSHFSDKNQSDIMTIVLLLSEKGDDLVER